MKWKRVEGGHAPEGARTDTSAPAPADADAAPHSFAAGCHIPSLLPQCSKPGSRCKRCNASGVCVACRTGYTLDAGSCISCANSLEGQLCAFPSCPPRAEQCTQCKTSVGIGGHSSACSTITLGVYKNAQGACRKVGQPARVRPACLPCHTCLSANIYCSCTLSPCSAHSRVLPAIKLGGAPTAQAQLTALRAGCLPRHGAITPTAASAGACSRAASA